MTRNEIRTNILSRSTWLRGFFMLIYIFVGYIAVWIIGVVILFQFCVALLSGKLNDGLLYFGQSLSIYISQILLYLTYGSDEKPFPFSSWPNPNEYHAGPITKLPNESEPPKKYE